MRLFLFGYTRQDITTSGVLLTMPQKSELTVTFPLINETLEVRFDTVLPQLSAPAVLALAAECDELRDDVIVSKVLRLATKDPANEDLRDALARHQAEYRSLSARLRSHRGYGLDGDEEPTVKVDFLALLSWLEAHKQDVLNAVLLDYIGPDLQVSNSKGWTWLTRANPQYVLPQELGAKKGVQTFASLRKAVTDAVATLGLLGVVTTHYQKTI